MNGATGSSPPRQDGAQVRAATRATAVVFAASGFVVATWASRIPQVRTHLHLDPSRLGLLLFTIAIGGVLALPLAGPLVAKTGARRAVATAAVMQGLSLGIMALGSVLGVPVLAVGLFLLGATTGVWDVAMNVQAAVIERHLARSIMSRFHAGFSLGTVAGALLGAAMAALHVPVGAHLSVVGAAVAVVVPSACRRFVPDTVAAEASSGAPAPAGSRPPRLAAWRERRTLLVGLVTLAFALAEGTGNDWISVSVIDHHHVAAAVGTLTFAAFLAAMTTGRWFGPALLDRWGRVAVLRVGAALAVAGLAVFVLGPVTPLAAFGAVLWGLGSSLGFPVGMSAGADEPSRAAARVSVIATIGYCAFLGGPPLIGFLGDHVTVTRALLVVGVVVAGAAVLAGATRPLAPEAPSVQPRGTRVVVVLPDPSTPDP